jgi:heptosyltransferase-2/heptosyltransferase-3
MNSKPDNPKKILVIKNDHIGDLIFHSGIFRELKKAYPQAKITAIASKVNKPLIEKNKNIDKILIVPFGKRFFKEFYKYPFILKKIRKEKFDMGLDLREHLINTFFLLYLGNVKYKLGFYKGFFSKLLLNYSEVKEITKNEGENMLNLLNNGLGLNATNKWPEIIVTDDDIKEADDFIKKNKLKKFICIVPDSTTPVRQWPLEEFDKVIKSLKKDYPKYQIVLSGVDELKMNWLIERNPELIKLGKVNIRMIYPLFQKSALIISLDTGTAHIAWAGKSKLIVLLLKASVPERKNVEALGKNSRTILEGDKKIKAEEVMRVVKSVLKKK